MLDKTKSSLRQLRICAGSPDMTLLFTHRRRNLLTRVGLWHWYKRSGALHSIICTHIMAVLIFLIVSGLAGNPTGKTIIAIDIIDCQNCLEPDVIDRPVFGAYSLIVSVRFENCYSMLLGTR